MRRILTAPAIRQEILQAIAPYYSEGQQDYVFDFVTLGSARILWRWINRRDREPSGEIAALLARLMGLARTSRETKRDCRRERSCGSPFQTVR